MKLTKQTEREILQDYNAYWDAYLKGDMETFGSYMSDDFTCIGSANGEVFTSKHDAVAHYSATADQMTGTAQMRNRNICIQPLDNTNVVVYEQNDLYILIGEEWTFYEHCRLSTILKHTINGWKAVHQHGSMPDHRTEEGQQIAAEKIAKENLELREAVKRRTVELENKTRQLEIEAAMERVRARTMAMRNSGELAETASVLFKQIKELGFEMWSCGFCIWKPKDIVEGWFGADAGGFLPPLLIPYKEEASHKDIYEAAQRNESAHEAVWEGKALEEHYTFLKTIPSVKTAIDQMQQAGLLLPSRQCYYVGFFKHGYLLLITTRPNKNALDISKRFAAVFDVTYTRFLDLQKAEAQAREAQIEVAVERVRAQSMAMHHPDDLDKINKEILTQLNWLQVQGLSGVTFYLVNEGGWVKAWDFSSPGKMGDPNRYIIQYDYNKYEMMGGPIKTLMQSDQSYLVADFPLEKLRRASKELEEINPAVAAVFKEALANGILTHQWSVCVKISNGILGIDTVSPPDEDIKTIVLKMAGAFNQAYTRFLDLQKAEAQAKEAKIEGALEKVRSRSLAMHKSDEIGEVVWTVVEKMKELEIELDGVSLVTYLPGSNDVLHWYANVEHAGQAETIFLPHFDDLIMNDCLKAKEQGVELLTKVYTKEEKNNYFNRAVENSDFKNLPEELKHWVREQPFLSFSFAIQSHSGIFLESYTDKLFSEQENAILVRFSRVFEQAYIRFMDLQKAEAQAKEAKIEASLERVRAKTMAMQHSDELIDAASVLFQQIEMLGAPGWNCSFNIWTEDKKYAVAWNATKDGFGRPFRSTSSEDIFLEFYTASQQGKDLFIREIGGKELALHYEYLSTVPGVRQTIAELKAAGVKFPDFQVFNIAYFAQGYLMFITYEPVPQLHDTFKRFAKVFEQTYTRFLDLQKAEAQARESQIQLALERVRARTMAMQHSDELAEASFVLDSQVRALGIKTQGCAFNIYGETDSTEWFSSEMGAMSPYKTPRENLFLRYYEAGEKGEFIHIEEFAGEACTKHYEYLITIPGMGDGIREMLRAGGSLPTKQIDHAVYFKYGYLLFITLEPVPEAHDTFIRFAKVFEQTYTRFLDLQKAEAQALRAGQDLIEIKSARKKAEDALTELQLTQKQLIQSEKMASLGELTAGIAHEIQNPLNFVNNFSDVSTELIDEMNLEIEKGNNEEAKQIALDLKQNLEKINHHGKRAGDIVKGMLQHSRSSSGVKEPTDINALVDEYLRLAYHGLRAKDKSFNATMKTDFDESMGNINVIPQDIGRVILNLITNAFYALKEKSKACSDGYEPTVLISTTKEGNNVLISVKDNGNGIPAHIKEKIFQPFFTTKPTGQGTGLGLSLSYDIVKAHGGELKVETTEAIGTEFTILLPIGTN